jgi:hypothetical protein
LYFFFRGCPHLLHQGASRRSVFLRGFTTVIFILHVLSSVSFSAERGEGLNAPSEEWGPVSGSSLLALSGQEATWEKGRCFIRVKIVHPRGVAKFSTEQ